MRIFCLMFRGAFVSVSLFTPCSNSISLWPSVCIIHYSYSSGSSLVLCGSFDFYLVLYCSVFFSFKWYGYGCCIWCLTLVFKSCSYFSPQVLIVVFLIVSCCIKIFVFLYMKQAHQKNYSEKQMLDKASLIFICVVYQRLYGVSNMVISISIIISVVIIINSSSIIIIVAIISLGFNLIFISCRGSFQVLSPERSVPCVYVFNCFACVYVCYVM